MLPKVNGLFVGKHNHSSGDTEIECFVFYNNGVFLQYYPVFAINFSPNSDTSLRKRISWTIKYTDSVGKKREAGGYTISGKNIFIQVYRQTPGNIYSLCEYKGQVLNESTIFISSCSFPDNKNLCRENFYLHRFQMEKPDSINWLMKKTGIGNEILDLILFDASFYLFFTVTTLFSCNKEYKAFLVKPIKN
ncbi:MAG: hypothetical protein WKF59_11425 [Chitinophagaceae bacterium]